MDGVTVGDEEAEELPAAFIVFTVNVIGVPLVRLLKLVVKTVPTVTAVPIDGVTKYPVIGESISEVGAIQDTVADALPATAETSVGAPGSDPVGVAVTDEEVEELPTEFVAFTVNVTAVPFVRLLTVAVRTLPTVTGLPKDGVSVYPVISEPPLEAGAVQETVTDLLPATAERPVGTSGSVAGVTAAEAVEATESPLLCQDCTVNVIGVPFVRLVK